MRFATSSHSCSAWRLVFLCTLSCSRIRPDIFICIAPFVSTTHIICLRHLQAKISSLYTTLTYMYPRMYVPVKIPTSSKAAAITLSRAVHSACYGVEPAFALRVSCLSVRRQNASPRRHFTSNARTQMKDFFAPQTSAPSIKVTEPAWHHPL